MKEALWSGIFTLVVLVVFIGFVIGGWPGEPDECIPKADLNKTSSATHTCYCEPFSPQDVAKHKAGIRQPFNTLSNLYAIVSGGFLAYFAFTQRRKKETDHVHRDTADHNRFRNSGYSNFYPIFYMLVVIFLGLGSMWFHASIVSWGGKFDQMSMYTLVSFLLAYSAIRLSNAPLYVFLILYGMCIIVYFALAMIGADSTLVIGISMVPYGILEVVIWILDWIMDPKARGVTGTFWNWENFKKYMGSLWDYWKYWFIGFLTFMIAVIIRGMSDSGGTLCISCSSAFQYHGVWHWLSGIMALLLYFHWVKAKKR